MLKYLQMTVDGHLQMKVMAGLSSIDKPVTLVPSICARLTFFALGVIQLSILQVTSYSTIACV